MFHNRWLKIDKAIEPSLIMWENLSYNKQARCYRICCTSLTAGMFTMITMLCILAVRSYDSGLRNFTPVINCSSVPEVAESLAL